MKILIVDDHADTRVMLDALLRHKGHTTAMAVNGPEALAILESSRPDAVLLDLEMPGMNGYEVARHIRARADIAAIPLVAFPGHQQERHTERARAARFDDHLLKPVSVIELEQMLARWAGSSGE